MTPFAIACLLLFSMSVLLMVRQEKTSSSGQKKIAGALAVLMGGISVAFLVLSIVTYG